ncbi:MAG: hypothetical protein H6739_25995 [Alphaproteobacteria bacterium]|nr:hypothetical protein [Alphaproteobacteria bacterium]
MEDDAPRSRVTLVVLGLLALVALVALIDGLRARRDLDVAIVTLQVNAIRQTILAGEQTRGARPEPCGKPAVAQGALGRVDPEEMGECGQLYFAREAAAGGVYWVEVSRGAADFEVHGLAKRAGETVHVRATRTEPAHPLPSEDP